MRFWITFVAAFVLLTVLFGCASRHQPGYGSPVFYVPSESSSTFRIEKVWRF
jgi:hypothetical protein